jgi:hypothetical protein
MYLRDHRGNQKWNQREAVASRSVPRCVICCWTKVSRLRVKCGGSWEPWKVDYGVDIAQPDVFQYIVPHARLPMHCDCDAFCTPTSE